jgi:hypothetical protein
MVFLDFDESCFCWIISKCVELKYIFQLHNFISFIYRYFAKKYMENILVAFTVSNKYKNICYLKKSAHDQ